MAAAVEETPRVRTLVLDADGWTDHRAGQHLDVRLTAEDGYQAERSYSIASAPGEPLAITVERLEDGEVSPYLVDEVRDGDVFEVRGPIGGYFVWDGDEPEPVLLVAGGSGVVPLAAMARQRARAGSTAPMRLLYSSRTLGRRDLPRRARDARRGGRVHAHPRAAAGLAGLRAADRRRAVARGRVPCRAAPARVRLRLDPLRRRRRRRAGAARLRPAVVRTERFGATG